MKEFKKILFPVVFSKASEKIVPYVEMMVKEFESKGIDLVIMGTHGRKGLDKVIFRLMITAAIPCPLHRVQVIKTLVDTLIETNVIENKKF